MDQTGSSHPSDERFQKVLEELARIKAEVVSTKNWFERHYTRPRILFRLVGSVVIVLRILVPFLSILNGVWQTLVLPATAVAIAGLTSLNAFFQWQNQWQSNRQTQFALEHLLSQRKAHGREPLAADLEPDSGNPTVRDHREALGTVG